MNIDDITGLEEELASKAEAVHTHPTSDIVGLVAALANKAPLDHTHDLADFPDFTNSVSNFSPLGHTHPMSEVTGLTNALNGKAASSHQHQISEVVNLNSRLDEKADTDHTHTMGDIEGLSGIVGDVFNLQANWNEIDPTAPGYINNKPNFGTAASKDVGTSANQVANAIHTHSANDITSGVLSKDRLPTLTAADVGAIGINHSHGNIGSTGTIGSVANRVVVTTDGGSLNTMPNAGVSGQVFTSRGSTQAPEWQTPPFISGDGTVGNVVKLTGAQYAALSPKNLTTLYIII